MFSFDLEMSKTGHATVMVILYSITVYVMPRQGHLLVSIKELLLS